MFSGSQLSWYVGSKEDQSTSDMMTWDRRLHHFLGLLAYIYMISDYPMFICSTRVSRCTLTIHELHIVMTYILSLFLSLCFCLLAYLFIHFLVCVYMFRARQRQILHYFQVMCCLFWLMCIHGLLEDSSQGSKYKVCEFVEVSKCLDLRVVYGTNNRYTIVDSGLWHALLLLRWSMGEYMYIYIYNVPSYMIIYMSCCCFWVEKPLVWRAGHHGGVVFERK